VLSRELAEELLFVLESELDSARRLVRRMRLLHEVNEDRR
jgi:hypothetical protein